MLTKDQWTARAVAYQEAAEHLRLHWTDDKTEIAQGNIVATRLTVQSEKCFKIADEL